MRVRVFGITSFGGCNRLSLRFIDEPPESKGLGCEEDTLVVKDKNLLPAKGFQL